MAFKLDPREVLAHLNRLGYRNITAEQLRDFIRDLKKLIKYEQQRCACHRDSNEDEDESYPTTSPETVRSYVDPLGYRPRLGGRVCIACNELAARAQKQAQQRPKSAIPVSAWRDDSDTSSSSSDSGSSSNASSVGSFEVPVRVKKLNEGRGKMRSTSVENLHEATKPRSSFIKPWRLLGPVPQPRSDPVALYHKYQTIWKQQKAPGESGHDELRWSVREKMLGQDPHPRPMSRTSSHDAVWRRRKLT